MDSISSQPPVWKSMLKPVVLWWRLHVMREVDHLAVIDRVQEDGGWTPRYAFMILMSAGIAILGLILSSPAVVIGAMLISPLMGPIVGLGFALSTADASEIRRTLAALAGGAVIAVLFTAFIVLLSPLQTVTSEIAARTRPNLFDLLVALFSALAGTYAMIRGKMGTIVGVAIATALMPPLATVGFGLATWNGTVFFGAFLLFLTNFFTIALSAAVMARLYGFGRAMSQRQTALQSLFIITIFMALAIPLGFSLRQIAWESTVTRQANDIISKQFNGKARISQMDIDFDVNPIVINASMLTQAYNAGAQKAVQAALTEAFGQPVQVHLEQIRVSAGADPEAAQIAAAQASRSALESQLDRLSDRLSVIAGVDEDQITLDRDHKRALVKAVALPDAGLATYRMLEGRAAKASPGWTIMVEPPALPLPVIGLNAEGDPDDAGARAVELAVWAASRVGAPITVRGEEEPRLKLIDVLRGRGVDARSVSGGAAKGELSLGWTSPAAALE